MFITLFRAVLLYRDKVLEITVIEKKLFKQTLRDVQSMYYDIGAYDSNYDEFKLMCHKAWDERFNYLYIDMTKIKKEGRYRIFNESKTTYIDCIPETEPF